MGRAYNRKDHFYNKAKEDGFRSRAAYKLLEIHSKHKLLSAGAKVLDLGAWPGGWLQVAAAKVGAKGIVVGIDLVEIEPLPEAIITTIKGDVRDEKIIESALQIAGSKFDLVISDMSPKLSGVKEVDHAQAAACAELAAWVAGRALAKGGGLITKLFKSHDADEFFRSQRSLYKRCDRLGLQSTRGSSNEYYFVGLEFLAPGTLQEGQA
jgi:23S rRNA (uridine2552-2'-O)-methyltransferase